MSRVEIRAEAIERVARYAYESDIGEPWAEASEEDRELVRSWAALPVDALGDMLPTGAKWGLRVPEAPFVNAISPMRDEAEARLYLHDSPGRAIMRRYTHEWQEASE